jgi:hypothetical protein
MHLAFYVSLAGFPLGIEGIEFQVEIMFGGFAGINGAPEGFHLLGH